MLHSFDYITIPCIDVVKEKYHMKDSVYDKVAKKTLVSIVEQIEESDTRNIFDCDNNGDMVTIEQSHEDLYIIQKHSAAKEIWMVSPVSGPHHFHLEEGEWTDSDGKTISDVLNDELADYGIKLDKLRVEF